MDYEDRIAEAKKVMTVSGYEFKKAPLEHGKDCVNNKDAVVRAVPRAISEGVSDTYINPAYLNKEEYKAVTDVRNNPTYLKNAELQEVETSERTGFELACRIIYIKAAKHLGATHPVMCLIRNLRD